MRSRKMVLYSKLKFPFSNKESRHKREEERSSLVSKASVREEYKEAFRTKSYIEIFNKVEGHLLRLPSHDDEQQHAAASSPSPSPSSSKPTAHDHLHLSEHLLEPSYQKPSTPIPNFHQFFTNYFDISLEASRICESLLTNINQARKNHLRIKKVIKITRRMISDDSTHRSGDHDELYRVLYKNLASFAAQGNPFSTAKFLELRESHVVMFQELTSTCRTLRRRAKVTRVIKKAVTVLVLMGFSALVVAALLLAAHCCPVGLVAVAPLVVMAKKLRRNCDEKWAEGVAAKLDVAARGVFIMINDFATMSRIVKRLEDEIEHRRYVADVCVRKGKNETLKEVVREFQMHESCFLEQLGELEKHICLCFLDINRSKRLLLGEMVKC